MIEISIPKAPKNSINYSGEERENLSLETQSLVDDGGSDAFLTRNGSESKNQFTDIMPTILNQNIANAKSSKTTKSITKNHVGYLQKTKALLFKNLMVLRKGFINKSVLNKLKIWNFFKQELPGS